MSMGGTTEGYSNGPLLVQELQTAGQLSANIFSFNMENINGTSYVDMGYQDTNSMSNPNDLIQIQMVDGFFWL